MQTPSGEDKMDRAYESRRNDEIPPLAWLLDLSPGLNRPILHHGRHVELFDCGFFEGAWDGDFAQAGFDRSANVFGSGAKVDRTSATFVPPSHTVESLTFFSGDRLCAVSNSIAFICAYSGCDLAPTDWRSGERFAAITQGLSHAVQTLRFRKGLLTVVYHHNFVIAYGSLREITPKVLSPQFEDFAAYSGYLLETARATCENAAHSARVRRYEPLITTVSSGYDSAAAAVIARMLGCREAVSLKLSQRGDLDSGAELAEILGLDLREFERAESVSCMDVTVAEFLCSGAQGEDYVYRVFQDVLSGKILFAGFGGDNVWSKGRPPTVDLKRMDLTGNSLSEFRIFRDYVLLPVPYIGCLRHPCLRRIANSAEMAPFSVGGEYDRPIPRRIVESAGVPRGAFARRKRAASLVFYNDVSLLSENVRAQIAAFEKDLRLSWRERALSCLLAARWHVGNALFRGFKRLTQLRGQRLPPVKLLRPIGRIGGSVLSRMFGPYEVFEHGHPRNAILQRWAVSLVKVRYRCVTSCVADTQDHALVK
jgi:hypothetical protein